MSGTGPTESPGGAHKRLELGSDVFCPGHGLATVVAVEDRIVGDGRQSFYVLRLARGGSLLLPTTKAVTSARALMSPAVAKALVKTLQAAPELDKSPWRERATAYTDTLRIGTAEGYTAILRQLLMRARTSKLSLTEKRQLAVAREYFSSEVGSVLRWSPEEMAATLSAASEQGADRTVSHA